MAKKIPYTKEELIRFLLDKQAELGRKPTKKDIPDAIKPYYRVLFGKWCYALEASGIVIPSEATLERRRRHKTRHRKTSAKDHN
jgi:hypothetical protein